MPFMVGREPIRRTLNYLNANKLYLKNSIQIFSINYNVFGVNHQGARDFVFWYVPQVQYKNPSVQVIMYKNMTPSPFIKCFYEDGKTMLIDIDNKTKEEILSHLVKVVGKSQETLKKETVSLQKKDNTANFGVGCIKSCICEIPGQIPCPSLVPLPNHMRGKFKYGKN